MNKEQLKKVFANDIDLGHYFVMKYIQKKDDINDLWQIQKVRGWREALIRKNMISEINGEFVLSDKANIIMTSIDELTGVMICTINDDDIPETPFVDFCEQLEQGPRIRSASKPRRIALHDSHDFSRSCRRARDESNVGVVFRTVTVVGYVIRKRFRRGC